MPARQEFLGQWLVWGAAVAAEPGKIGSSNRSKIGLRREKKGVAQVLFRQWVPLLGLFAVQERLSRLVDVRPRT
jgi:hypothetical protein